MPKYLIEATYTAQGLQGVAKDKASGRKAAVEKLVAGVGGKVESIYYALGETDVIVIFDCPDTVSAAAVSLAVSSSGLVRTRTISLLSVEEVDQALSKSISYRAPGA